LRNEVLHVKLETLRIVVAHRGVMLVKVSEGVVPRGTSCCRRGPPAWASYR
jgi:hypothetical protein